MKKRILAILLSLCMVVGILPVTALEEEGTETQSTEPQNTETQNTETQSTETQSTETQSTETQSTETQLVADVSKLAEAFPDENFRNYVATNILNIQIYNDDTVLTSEDINAVNTAKKSRMAKKTRRIPRRYDL